MKQFLSIVFLCILICGTGSVARAVVNPLPLTDQDCLKCHFKEAQTVAGQESAHKNDIGCLDCHVSHPPEGEVVIPECSTCHDPDDQAHFGLQNCQGCHNPHAPLVSDFSALDGNGRPACITCHDDIEKQLTDMPSAHGEQDCTECHQQHGLGEGQFQTCVDCHDKHSEDMEFKDCLSCHKPHQPTAYDWNADINGKFCAACHEEIVQNFTDNGAAHSENLSCTECHAQHPPRKEHVIPSCADCHDPGDNEHFAAGNCTGCHNPHSPKKIDFGSIENLRSVCLGCHEGPGEIMQKRPTAHAKVECTECHPSHGAHLSCLDCHEGHSDSMQYDDCLKCHQHHAPMPPTLAKKIPSVLCGSCHEDQYSTLKVDKTRHGKLQCVYCHKGRHKVIQKCRTCHGEPHETPLHKRFPDCHKCHGDPHSLNQK